MKKIALILMLLNTAFFFSQMELNRIVVLKNGNVLRGTVFHLNDSTTKVRIKGGSNFIFKKNEIQEITSFKSQIGLTKFYNRTTMGVLSGSQASFTANIVNGYRFNKEWGLGAGLGTEFYLGNMHLSYFADLQYNFGSGRTIPFAAINFGISEPVRQGRSDKGGVLIGAQVGVMHFTNDFVAMTTSLGYRLSIMDFRNSWFEDYITRGYFNQVEIRFGFALK